MEPPEEFADGFNWKAVLGAVFLGFIIMPGSMYLTLFIGNAGSINTAARWVMIILFAEVARRSFKDLKMQEIYILYYMTGLALAMPFQGLLWQQFFVQSDYVQAMGIASEIPTWIAPTAVQIQEAGPGFFRMIWLAPILFTSFSLVIWKIDHYGLGYVLYRLTSDVEELPFPMAPVAASGITALVNTKEDKEKWRWRCFSIGGVIGLVFGAVYIGFPAVTGAVLAKSIQLIPVPWLDLTPQVGHFLPAVAMNITFDLGAFIWGMVMPFWAVVGGFLGVVITIVANPILYQYKILHSWEPGTDLINTLFLNNIDFYLSFSIGLTVAIALVSMGKIFGPVIDALRARGKNTAQDRSRQGLGQRMSRGWNKLVTDNVKRGDFSIFIALGIYILTSATWIGVSIWLIPGFPWPYFVFYAVVYTPIISYATAKLEGLCGQAIEIPMIREATYILSGYRGVKIWFAPAPLYNYGMATVDFRILELTGTKIISQIKAQIVTIPIIIVASLVFSHLFWTMAPVPSEAYPFAQQMWDLQAKNTCLMFSATSEGSSQFLEAWNWKYFNSGLLCGTGAFMFLSFLGLPTLLVFGLVRGLGQGTPGPLIFEMIGALVGRFYFRRKFGDMWMKYTPVMMAGFACGMGLIAMVAVGIGILAKMIKPLIF